MIGSLFAIAAAFCALDPFHDFDGFLQVKESKQPSRADQALSLIKSKRKAQRNRRRK